MGDPAGIGPEIVLKALLPLIEANRRAGTLAPDPDPDPDPELNPDPDSASASASSASAHPSRFLVYGDLDILRREASRLGVNADRLPIRQCSSLPPDLPTGRMDARAGQAAFLAVREAGRDALAGRVRAIVTAPLNKEAMNAAGIHYPGHTEILAQIAGGVPVRMMLFNDELCIVLVTIHRPLREAIDNLSTEAIAQTIRLTDRHLRSTGISAPRIAVAGLNPHAGEGGLLGREELDVIAPAIALSRSEGIDATGPHAPDTIFMQARGFARFDVVVAMYHDQGLIPIKYLGLERGVNITVGLPFVRTSPDHGTAFDIAGQGRADPSSMSAAIRMAERLSHPSRFSNSAIPKARKP